jgi:hypothetical protein
MSCCGQNRQRLRDFDSSQHLPGPAPAAKRPPRTQPLSIVYFEYVGKTGLTVIGPITGRRYRFPKPGAKISVDGNDALSLTTVPNLRQTHGP